MSAWGREVMWDVYTGLQTAWVSREAVPEESGAILLAALEAGDPPSDYTARPVLMREQSEVEARIEGNEWPCYVECTKRAKRPEPFWRVERKENPDYSDAV